MEDQPVKINDEYKAKQTDSLMSPLKAGSDVTYKQFKYSYNHSDKERIQRSQEVNSVIDTLPTNIDKKAFLLRPRAPEKEIGPEKLKFKASSSLERIQETL
jgi:hypothetical protein